MPAFNSARTIEAAIETVCVQSGGDWELVVVDDGSTDDTARIVAALAERDARIRLETQENAGTSAARNAGIAKANGSWLIFLDSDDALTNDALAVWREAISAQPRARWFNATCLRFIGQGRGVPFGNVRLDDPAAAFANGCPVAIHACLIDRELTRDVGGFDPTLRTCEDWDFWRRVSATGVRPAFIDAAVAEYRMDVRSASTSTRQILRDGLTVIDRAHASPGFAPDRLAARAAFCGYVAAITLGQGDETDWIFECVGREAAPELSPELLADFLLIGTAVGRLEPIERWPNFAPDALRRLEPLLTTFETHFQAGAIARRTLRRLVARVAEIGERAAEPVRFGDGYLFDVDLGARAPSDLHQLADAEFVQVRGWWAGAPVAHADIALVDGAPTHDQLIDGLLETESWAVLENVILRPILDEVSLRRRASGETVAVRRGLSLGPCPASPSARALLDAVAWPLFMQELGGAFSPALSSSSRRRTLRRFLTTRHQLAGRQTSVAITDVPNLWAWRRSASVEVSVAGEVVDVFSVARHPKPITSRALASRMVERNGTALVWMVLRAYLAGEANPSLSLRDGLRLDQSGSAPAKASSTVCLRPGALPHPARLLRRRYQGRAASIIERAATAAPDLVVQGTDLASVARSAAVAAQATPVQLAPPTTPRNALTHDALPHRGAADFEAWFAGAQDPWDYTSGYERTKYEQTLQVLPTQVGRTLEIGCAEGHFTQMLAPRTTELMATDVSSLALERAAERCAGLDHVAFRRHNLFVEQLPGVWDTVICSETLYYVGSVELLKGVAEKLADGIAVGGAFVTAHANLVVDAPDQPGFNWDEAFGAATIERTLLATGRFALELSFETPMYRVQRYQRITDHSTRPVTERRAVQASADLNPDVLASFLPAGGAPVIAQGGSLASQLPILMYHRIAPDGAASMRRYRTDPEQFETQLRYLAEAGYTSITPEQWRDAVLGGRNLPSRPVLLTFDDGYQDFADHAAPALLRHGFKATVMLVTDLVGRESLWDRAREAQPLMGWESIKELQADGFSFGAHTRTHPHLTGVPSLEALEEIGASVTAIHEALGIAPTSFAYPYGDVTAGVRSLVGACGVALGLSCDPGHATASSDLLRLPRIEVRGDRELRDFIAALGTR